jgi:hypothetical protein
MAKNIPCIRYAVAATASCHIGNKLEDKTLKMQSLQLRLEATQALRQQLTNDAEQPDISLIACMILLAQLDVRAQVSSLCGHSNNCNSSALGTAWNLEPT